MARHKGATAVRMDDTLVAAARALFGVAQGVVLAKGELDRKRADLVEMILLMPHEEVPSPLRRAVDDVRAAGEALAEARAREEFVREQVANTAST